MKAWKQSGLKASWTLECKLSLTQACSAQAAQGLQSSCTNSTPLSDTDVGCIRLQVWQANFKGQWQQQLKFS